MLYEHVAQAAAEHNTEAGSGEAKTAPHFLLRRVDLAGRSADDVTVELSDQVRDKALFAFVDIPAGIIEAGDFERLERLYRGFGLLVLRAYPPL